jgi:hypothetical protein
VAAQNPRLGVRPRARSWGILECSARVSRNAMIDIKLLAVIAALFVILILASPVTAQF